MSHSLPAHALLSPDRRFRSAHRISSTRTKLQGQYVQRNSKAQTTMSTARAMTYSPPSAFLTSLRTASGRVGGSACARRHSSTAARSSACRRTRRGVPRPVVGGLPLRGFSRVMICDIRISRIVSTGVPVMRALAVALVLSASALAPASALDGKTIPFGAPNQGPAYYEKNSEGPDAPKTAAGRKLDAQLRAHKITCLQWVRGLQEAGEEWERVGPNVPEEQVTFDTRWSPLAKRCKLEFFRKNGSLQPPED